MISNIPTAEEQAHKLYEDWLQDGGQGSHLPGAIAALLRSYAAEQRQKALEQAVKIVERAVGFEWTADRETLVRAIHALKEIGSVSCSGFN